MAKAAFHLIGGTHDVVEYFLDLLLGKHFLLGNLEAVVGLKLVRLLEVLNQVIGLLLNVCPPFLVGSMDLDQQLLP